MSEYTTITSDKSKKTAMWLCLLGLLGIGGLHDFYVGKIGSGFLKFITCDFFFIGFFIDIIKITSGSYLDNSGQPLRK